MLKGIIPDPGQLTKKAIMLAATTTEGVVMLTIAFFLDVAGIFLFVLSLVGLGIPATWLLNFLGTITIGTWVVVRPMFRKAIAQATEQITNKMMNIGGGLEGLKKFQGSEPPGLEVGKKAAKTGVKLGISATRLFIAFTGKMIPFLGNLIPWWTILVIFELVQGEI